MFKNLLPSHLRLNQHKLLYCKEDSSCHTICKCAIKVKKLENIYYNMFTFFLGKTYLAQNGSKRTQE